MPGMRRKARTVAFQTLFEVDCSHHEPESTLQRLGEERHLPEEAEQFARQLVTGVLANRAEIDEIIKQAAPTWPLEQMSKVDVNVLRIAIFEVLLDNKTPLKAAINEAVELAKIFGSDNSAKFVNGVLGTVTSRGAPKILPTS